MANTSKKQKNFEAEFTRLNNEYQMLLARRDMINEAISDKESELQTLLDKAAGLR